MTATSAGNGAGLTSLTKKEGCFTVSGFPSHSLGRWSVNEVDLRSRKAEEIWETLFLSLPMYAMSSPNLSFAISLLGLDSTQTWNKLGVALTHTSALNEDTSLKPEERQRRRREYFRLAHLGDALLSAVVSEHLFDQLEGELSKERLHELRSEICSREELAFLALLNGLQQVCVLGQGEIGGNPRAKPALYGEMFEAVVGAVYLDLDRDYRRFSGWCLELFLKDRIDELLGT
jgi:ribonuclease III